MKTKNNIVKYLLISSATVILILTFTGCSTSLMTSSWVAEPAAKEKIASVIVMAILPEDDHNVRAQMEKHLVNDLNAKGVNASSAYLKLGPTFGDGLKENEIMNQLSSLHVDSILTIVLLNKEKEKYYVPGRVYYTPYYIRHRRFWGYYATMYERVYEPGYYLEKTNFFWESNLFLMSTKELRYSSQTKSFDPNNIESMAHEYGKIICNDLQSKGLLKNE